MQRSVWKWGALALLGLVIAACADEGVGDPCIPETIPCVTDANGVKKCGFNLRESYIESSSVQCRGRLCIVHRLDNGTNDMLPADPTNACDANGQPAGCVSDAQLSASIFCTCRCGGPSTSLEFCDCPDGFRCDEVLTLGGDGIRGNYCVRDSAPVSNEL
jgi:hypothetical protein